MGEGRLLRDLLHRRREVATWGLGFPSSLMEKALPRSRQLGATVKVGELTSVFVCLAFDLGV